MGTLELRNKLIEQFNLFVQDDSKLAALDGVFDAMNVVDSQSLVSEEHYLIVEKRRHQYHSGKTSASSWDEVKQKLKNKYGF